MEDKCEYNTAYRGIAKKSDDFEDGKLIEEQFKRGSTQTYTKEQVVEFCRYILRNEYSEDLDEKTTTELFDLWVKSKQVDMSEWRTANGKILSEDLIRGVAESYPIDSDIDQIVNEVKSKEKTK